MTVTPNARHDRGAVLPLVLVISVVLSALVAAIATYATANLRYGQTVELRADELASAEAAMRDAIERLAELQTTCGNDLGGPTIVNPSFPELNGVPAEVRCSIDTASQPVAAGWALVLTGSDVPGYTTRKLDSSGGTSMSIEGPIFVDDPLPSDDAVMLGGNGTNDLTITQGDLWYEDDSCDATWVADPSGGEEIVFEPGESPNDVMGMDGDPNVKFAPVGERQPYCTNASWEDLVGTSGPPSDPAIGSLPVDPVPDTTTPGCAVWSQGNYSSTALAQLASYPNNYFRSGAYLFDNVGAVELTSNVTMGNVDDVSGYPVMSANAPCDAVRTADAADGAALYLRGDSRITFGNDASLEISGRDIDSGTATTRVALQVLDWETARSEPILERLSAASTGAAFSGLIWAPTEAIDLQTMAEPLTDAAFRGGAVLGALIAQAASSNGFLIRVATSEYETRTILRSTAGNRQIIVVGDWRPDTSAPDFAVNSWRVCSVSGVGSC